MFAELTKIAIGLTIMMFHRQIADFMLEQERSLVLMFRQRGVPVPAALTTEMGRNIYFGIGAFIVLFQIVRIWLSVNGRVPLV
jgi:hypothetical protein